MPHLAGIRLVAFDLDGTLIDSLPDLAVAVDAMLLELDMPAAGEAKVGGWVGNGSHKLIERALHDALGEMPDDARLTAAHERFLDYYAEAPSARTRVYPGVHEALAALRERGVIVTLITNKPQAFIAPILESLALAGYFDLTLGGDSLPRKKPDPAPLLHVAEHFGVAPQHCLMVGDSRHDIDAGKRAGFHTLAVPYGYNHGEPVSTSRPGAMVESLAQLV
ncbi:phosphoglycolate phosphatase [Modicisalibacter muralis]|uniref:Phosphoglycolate phosphatase n=1 Tax=Modicisalibacter muralis TaxID=119000 RepID=A0A1G9RBN1_9GAMM|nr:phosphoglycolate phosphatase [Halomonas muralis]SDM19795.1 phosphoglycolate phosphatase [Halomonas muralis]